MTPPHPYHSDDTYMHNMTIQEFVDPPHEMTDEERNRPQYGRPVRKPKPDQPAPRPTDPLANG